MQVKKWWIYKLRCGSLAATYRRIEDPQAKYPMQGGFVLRSDNSWTEDQWTVGGRYWASGIKESWDLVTPICSAKQLVFRKLNPPTALVAAVEAKRAEEVLFT